MKKLKLFTLGMVMCLSLAMMTGCGRNDNADDNKNGKFTHIFTLSINTFKSITYLTFFFNKII